MDASDRHQRRAGLTAPQNGGTTMATSTQPQTPTPAAEKPKRPVFEPTPEQQRQGISIHALTLTKGDNTPKQWVGRYIPVEDASDPDTAIRLGHATDVASIMEGFNSYRHVQQNRAFRDAVQDPKATIETATAAVREVKIGEQRKGTRSGANAAAQAKAVKLDAVTQRAKDAVLAGDLKKVASLLEFDVITQAQVDEWRAEAAASRPAAGSRR